MCQAVTIIGDMSYPCKQDGWLCYYHLKVKRLDIQPTDGVEYIMYRDTGEILYGSEEKHYWNNLYRSRNKERP